ncbi:MAG: FtsX-like permease family protein, partial [Candidatus Hodarchaeales archaeon]
ISYSDSFSKKAFIDMLIKLRDMGMKSEKTYLFIIFFNSLVAFIGVIPGMFSGFLVFLIVLFTFHPYLVDSFLGNQLMVVTMLTILFIILLVFSTIICIVSDIDILQYTLSEKYREEKTWKSREFFTTHYIDITLFIMGIILVTLIASVNIVTLAMETTVYDIFSIIFSLSLLLLYFSFALIITRFFKTFMELSLLFFKKTGMMVYYNAARNVVRRFLSSRTAIIFLIFILTYSYSTVSLNDIHGAYLEQESLYNTGAEVFIRDREFSDSDLVFNLSLSLDFQYSPVLKIVREGSVRETFLGISPASFIKAAYVPEYLTTDNDITVLISALNQSENMLFNYYAKQKLSIDINEYMSFPEMGHELGEGLFQVKGLFKLWPFLVMRLGSTESPRDYYLDELYYIMNIDTLSYLLNNNKISNVQETFYGYYIKCNGSTNPVALSRVLRGNYGLDAFSHIASTRDCPWNSFDLIFQQSIFLSIGSSVITLSLFVIFMLIEKEKQFAIYKAIGITTKDIRLGFMLENVMINILVQISSIIVMIPLVVLSSKSFQVITGNSPFNYLPSVTRIIVLAGFFLVFHMLVSLRVSARIKGMAIDELLKVE